MEIAVEVMISAKQLDAANGDAARLVFERFLLEAYRTAQLSHAVLGHLLGLQTPAQIDEYLKTHGGYNVNYNAKDFRLEQGGQPLQRGPGSMRAQR